MSNVILVVEDEGVISRMYEKILSFEGYEVVVAADGEAGWDQAKKIKPALILLDFMMPKLNGLQVLEKLKSDPETAPIPVVMLTNLAAPQEAELASQKGALKYIIKSETEPKQVVEMVREYLPKPPQPAS
ncbi:response regulator [Candidatus Microgenomates bacterium]|nr:response regulator [Candidatus Microgenomates bacterium]